MLPCRFHNCLGHFEMFTVEGCSETRLSKHSSNHIYDSVRFRKYIGYEYHLLFQNVPNLMKISKMERKIAKMFLLFQIILFVIVLADSKYNIENTSDRQSMF